MKNTKEAEQYSNTKIRMLPKQSPKNIRKNEGCTKLVKMKLAKPQCHMLNKNKLKSKKLLKIERKKTKIIKFKSINFNLITKAR